MKLYVGNLPYSLDDAGLVALFAAYGPVESARVVRNPATGASKGFGFVEMSDGDALKARGALDGSQFQGRKIFVDEARGKKGAAPAA